MKKAIYVFVGLGSVLHECAATATTLREGVASLQAEELSFSSEAVAGKPTPIQRVVTLLQEMKDQLSKEASADQSAYDKMVCWCETNEKEKKEAVAAAEAKIADLESEVEERSAHGAQLSTDVAALKGSLVERKESLKTAVALREKEQAELMGEEKEFVQAITMLKDAIMVLQKHNAGLLEVTPALQSSLGATLRWAALKHDELLELQPERQTSLRQTRQTSGTALLSFGSKGGSSMADALALEAINGGRSMDLPVELAARVVRSAASRRVAAAALNQEAASQPFFESHSSRSGQVFGVLQQLLEDFESNLGASQKAEAQAREAFEQLKSALVQEIDSGEKKLDDIEENFATNIKALSDAKEDLTATRESRSADVKFLTDLRLECNDLDHQWTQRSTSRGEEIRAVSETIAMLTAGDARDLFHKKMGTGGGASFMQLVARSTEGQRQQALRSRAAATLLREARSLEPHTPAGYQAWQGSLAAPHEQLSALAVQVQIDSFERVKKSIDELVVELKAQQEEEVKEKAFCVESLNVNEKATFGTNEELSDIKDAIGGLEETIEKLVSEIAANRKAIETTEVELKKASEVRKEENQNYQEEVLDQRTMQNILEKAVARLRSVYQSKALLQQPATSPVKFQPYKQSAGGSPVIGLMEQIVEDSKALEQQATAAEQKAQGAYKEFVDNADDCIRTLNGGIEMKTKMKAATRAELAEKEAAKSSTEDRLEGLQDEAKDLHEQCDFLLKNFDARQKARLQEIEALGAAKAFLSGMS